MVPRMPGSRSRSAAVRGMAVPVVTPATDPAGIWRSAAMAAFCAGTAGVEYQDAVAAENGRPRLSSHTGPACDAGPRTSVAHRAGFVLSWARLAAPGSPGSNPQVVSVSESKAVLKGASSGTGSG